MRPHAGRGTARPAVPPQADVPTATTGASSPAAEATAAETSEAAEVTERWLPVAGYEGLYEVSDLGRVRSPRGLRRPDGTTKPNGHLMIQLYRGGRRTAFTVHRLVLEAFVGPRPLGLECRHLDGDKANNRLANLVWGTQSENMLDRVRHGTHHQANKTSCPSGHTDYYRLGNGERRCRTCDRASSLARYHRRRQAVAS